ncbi:periplasmic binding protein-like I [Zopfochytrium polystomum]|nr:periplasmic binding protein-like I [Zopfochytrium polystomum]
MTRSSTSHAGIFQPSGCTVFGVLFAATLLLVALPTTQTATSVALGANNTLPAAEAATTVALDAWGYPQFIVPPKKATKATVSIAAIQAYDLIAYFRPTDFSSYASYAQVMDTGYQMAVEDINADPLVLPDVTVRLKRINGFDVMASNGFFSGGYAAVNMYANVINDPSVVGVSGFLTDVTTQNPASVAGQLNLPFCGPTQSSPMYNNKGMFPTFFRTAINMASFAPSLELLHRKFGVKRLTIVYTTEYTLAAVSIKSYLEARGITIAAWVEIKPNPTAKDFDFYFGSLKRADARYIISCSAPYDSGDIYFAANKSGLVGPSFVWSFLQTPYPRAATFSQAFGPGAEALLDGIVGTSTDTSLMSNPLMLRFIQQYLVDAALYPSWFITVGGYPSNFGAMAYDCAKLMLMGIDKVMKERKATAADLASGKLQQYFTTELFSLTSQNYSGPTRAPLPVDTSGDLSATILLTQFNLTDPMNGQPRICAIVSNDSLADTGTPFIFFGGSTTPPPDGTVYREWLVNSPSSGKGLLILVLGGVGVVFGLVSIALNFIYARQPSFKAASTTFTHIICVGCIMAFVSAAFMVSDVTQTSCRVRLWLQVLGFALVVGSMLFKMSRMLAILTAGTMIRKELLNDFVGFGAVFIITGIDAAFLAGWTVAQNPKPTFQIDPTSEKWMCKSSTSMYPGHIILYAYNGLILLIMLYIARQVQIHERAFSNGAADTAATMSAGFVALFLGVVTLPLISGGDPGPATDVARFIVVWILGVLCLGLVVGPKIFAVIISQRERMSPKLKVQSVAGISTGLLGISSGAAIDAKLPPENHTVGHHVRPIPRTQYVDLGRLVYRQYKQGFWTHWKHVRAGAMHYSDKNLVVFEGLESSQGFRLGKPSNGAHSHLELRGSVAVVRSKADITGSTEAYLELEFDSPAAGEDFKQKLDRFFE